MSARCRPSAVMSWSCYVSILLRTHENRMRMPSITADVLLYLPLRLFTRYLWCELSRKSRTDPGWTAGVTVIDLSFSFLWSFVAV